MQEQGTVNRKDLASLAAASGIDVPPAAVEPLAVYLEMLCRWNAAMNLVGARHWRDVLTRLAADSFHLAAFLEELPLPEQPLTWDLGAGAGLPGIPLRMVWTRGEYCMVEVRQKRALFLSSALARLRLPSTRVFRGSVEQFFQGRPCPADCIVSRAFMPWPRLLELALPRLRPHGVLAILALTPAPDRLPAPWRLTGERSYAAAGSGRWFWALSPSDGVDMSAAGNAQNGPAGEGGPCLG